MRAKSGSAIRRPDLGIMIMEYVETQGAGMGFIGLEVMPVFRTPEQSGIYPVIPKEALLKIPKTSRAPRGAYNRGDYEYERGTYTTSENGWEEPIDDTERKMFDAEAPGAADFIAVLRATKTILRAQEKRIADKVFDDSVFTAHSVSNEWDDPDNATPFDDVNDGILSFRSACGMLPDALIISYTTFLNLKRCDQIIDQVKYTFPGIDINKMTSAQLAQAFDVPRVLIGGAVYDSSKPGTATSISDLWDEEYAALVKIGAGEDVMEPCVGRTFLWTEDSPENPVVEQYREEDIRSDVFRCRHNTDEAYIQSKNSSGTAVSEIHKACVYLFDNIHS
jgi:hypothetical protein